MAMLESIWPFAAGACFLLLVAWTQWKLQRVPNALIGLFLLGALVTAAIVSAGVLPGLDGGIGSAIVGLIVGGAVLLPLYIMGGLGAGCVKAQAVFGAWVGCALPIGSCLAVILTTTIVAGLVTFAVGFVAYSSKQSDEQDGPILFPAQITLSLGTLIMLISMWLLV